MRETPRAAAAFEYYAAMGPNRSLAKLYKEIQTDWAGKVPTFRRIEEWSRKHGWQERVKEYDRERAAEKRMKHEAEIERINKMQLDAGDEMMPLAIQQIKDLIEIGKFGSQAAVTLLQTAAAFQRTSLGADKVTEQEETVAPIQLIIELDNTPITLPKSLDAPATVVDVTPRLLPEPASAREAPQGAVPAIPEVVVEIDASE